MLKVKEGQCGLCSHFGEEHPDEKQLHQIRVRNAAPEDYVDKCGHPQHASLNLVVTAVSGCDAFELAPR